jgi:hypothetical protein
MPARRYRAVGSFFLAPSPPCLEREWRERSEGSLSAVRLNEFTLRGVVAEVSERSACLAPDRLLRNAEKTRRTARLNGLF